MSYAIEYESFCLKTQNGYTILWLAGDNNVTDGGRYNRRSRDWSCFMNMLDQPAEQFMAVAGKMASESPNHEIWKRVHGGWVYGRDVPAWVSRQLKHAMTVEDLICWNRTSVSNLRCALHVWRGNACDRNVLSAYVTTTEALEAWVGKAKAAMETEAKMGNTAYYSLTVYTEKIRKPRVFNGDAIFQCRYGYLSRIDGQTCEWCRDRKKAMAVPYDQAVSMLNDNRYARWLDKARLLEAKNFDPKVNVPVVIYFENGKFAGQFIAYSGRSSVKVTPYEQAAKKYSSEKTALSAMDRLKAKVGSYGTLGMKHFVEKKKEEK